MEIPKIELEDIIARSKDAIIETVKTRAAEQLTWMVKDEVQKEISAIVKAFVETHIKPDLEQVLADARGEMLEQVAAGLKEVGQQVAGALVKKSAENLGQSWKVKAITDGLFG